MARNVPENFGELPMIAYLSHDRIDKSLWDACIAAALNGNVYAWSWYLDMAHPGWDALVEINDGKYLTVMPITNKKKYGINYLCQPFFVQQLGVFSTEPLTSDKVLLFLKAIPKRYRLVEIRLNEGNPIDDRMKGVSLHRNHLLDLHDNYDTLLSNYHENTWRNLKKSLRYGHSMVKEVSIADLIALFRTDRGVQVKHWGDAEYARLTHIAETAIASSKAFIYGIKDIDNENILCGALFLMSHHRITFLFSGNSEAGKVKHAMTFLMDQVIREYAGQPMVLDFEGSDDANLARFYQGFGAQPVTYPAFQYRLFNPLR